MRLADQIPGTSRGQRRSLDRLGHSRVRRGACRKFGVYTGCLVGPCPSLMTIGRSMLCRRVARLRLQSCTSCRCPTYRRQNYIRTSAAPQTLSSWTWRNQGSSYSECNSGFLQAVPLWQMELFSFRFISLSALKTLWWVGLRSWMQEGPAREPTIKLSQRSDLLTKKDAAKASLNFARTAAAAQEPSAASFSFDHKRSTNSAVQKQLLLFRQLFIWQFLLSLHQSRSPNNRKQPLLCCSYWPALFHFIFN